MTANVSRPAKLRQRQGAKIYSLLDGAAPAMTCPIDLGDEAEAPDFMPISIYKIFGFPNIGALMARKETAHLLRWRKYFGGGTVDMVSVVLRFIILSMMMMMMIYA